MKHLSLELYIGNLLIDEANTVGQQAITGFIEQALIQLIAERGLPISVDTHTLDLGSIVVQTEPRATLASISTQVAQSIYEQLVHSQTVAPPKQLGN